MSLTISYVERLDDVLGPVREFLSRDRDLFAKPRIVVPNAGTKAWLLGELARDLGASPGGADRTRGCDGVVANVDFSFPGTILSLLQPPRGPEPDPWSFDRLTFAVLDVISDPDEQRLDIPFDVQREPLLAARRIAGLFDDYHVRRPEMIQQWEGEKSSQVMNPTANDEQKDNEPVADRLAKSDTWQYELWRLVSRRIGANSPPARASLTHRAPHEPLLVAGLQSLSWPQLRCLQQLAEACDVLALLVHPSPGLAMEWRTIGPKPLEDKLRGRPLRRSRKKPGDIVAAEADEPVLPDGFDPLPATWLGNAREMQDLLVSQGIAVVDGPASAPRKPDSLLHRMQASVATGREPDDGQHDPAQDHSVAIHRCHDLSRQAEVLHDALLHAFADPQLNKDKRLAPHDVLIVSPCLEQAAPHLEAVFQKTYVVQDGPSGTRNTIRLPLVIADRGLRETSEAVDLLSALVALPGSRCSVDDVLGVAGHPLVRAHLGIDDETVQTWLDLVDRTQVRWGIDHAHRTRRGLTIDKPELRDVHTWKAGLEQMLLGATLPDATPKPELGGVVPLGDLDPADIQRIAKLVRVLDVIGDLANRTVIPRPTAEWCDAIEKALLGLCGANCRHLGEPLAQLRRLREAAAGAATDRAVSFDEIRMLLAEWSDEKAGRQPLRTGAITATSMVPMRGVPFRVVCVIGYDDGAVGSSDPSKDDLVAKMPLVGDGDPRVDGRRALLDCLLAARDRLVITCTGRNVKTNERVPLVTPLAELVDFAVRHGVGRERVGDPSRIEIEHPRHHLAQRNFLPGQVQQGLTWSHDAVAAQVAAARATRSPGDTDGSASGPQPAADFGPEARPEVRAAERSRSASATGGAPCEKPEIDISMLEMFVKDPLGLYLKEKFQISTWRDDDESTPATLPLALEDKEAQQLTRQLLEILATKPREAESWRKALLVSGRLPLGPNGHRQLHAIEDLAAGIVARAKKMEVPVSGTFSPDVRIELPNARIVGRLAGVGSGTLTTIKAKKLDKGDPGRPLHVAAVQLLVARTLPNLNVERAVVISKNPEWWPGKKTPTGRPVDACQGRTILASPEVDIRERLTMLCDLVIEALANPRGLFGLHDAADDDREEAFIAFLRAKNWATGELLYPKKSEALVYGLTPTYAAVFPHESPAASFIDRYKTCLRLDGQRGTSNYKLS